MLLTPHFALREFIESATAQKYGIENAPTPEVVGNLLRLCQHTLEPLREALELPIIVTSGYRCKALNDIISHHSKSSQHLVGRACDFYVGWGTPTNGRGPAAPTTSQHERLLKAYHLIVDSCAEPPGERKIDFDQLILYPHFIHVSYVSTEANRHLVLAALGNGKYRQVKTL